MQTVTQVSGDDQLVVTARDCFYFVTKFFEPISVSATHIYHSALELSPLSSIIRKLYYHRRLARFPRVETGIRDSWDPSIAIPKDDWSRESWSPCGQFIAVQTEVAVKIRDAQTFEVVSTFPATRHAIEFPPSYSSDGNLLACYTRADEIIIWDIQTGGVAKKIKAQLSSAKECVWSPEGGTFVVLSNIGEVAMFDVASSTTITNNTPSRVSYLWAHNDTLRVMTTAEDNETTTISIFEIEPARAMTKIGSFSIQLEKKYRIGSFSPTTYRIVVETTPREFVIMDIRNSGKLLVEKKHFHSHSFSSDGSRFPIFWRFPYLEFRSSSLYSMETVLFSRSTSSIFTHFVIDLS